MVSVKKKKSPLSTTKRGFTAGKPANWLPVHFPTSHSATTCCQIDRGFSCTLGSVMKSGEASALCPLKWNILMQLGLYAMLWSHLTRYINALWDSRIIFCSIKRFSKLLHNYIHLAKFCLVRASPDILLKSAALHCIYPGSQAPGKSLTSARTRLTLSYYTRGDLCRLPCCHKMTGMALCSLI